MQIISKIEELKFGLIDAENVKVSDNDDKFDKIFEEFEEETRRKFADTRPSENEIVSHVRRMYRRIGWEPTKYRPSSEALIRRILQGKGLYRINNIVDYGNLVSAKYHLPLGLYDVDKITGDIIVDVGKAGESYQGISKPLIHAEGKMILRDETGIFGNPTADSLRTSITNESTHILAVFFCPSEVNDDHLQKTLNTLSDYYLPFCKNKKIDQNIVKN
ncbi:MAG: B3/4 domain-containing protein [Calditrichaceae bacterium]